ncbi:MAG TPA: metal-dependent hydrolase [Azospirillaceae bacterium]|nr:metal-dependent hydrolase [Azospirillaceae bacterium]
MMASSHVVVAAACWTLAAGRLGLPADAGTLGLAAFGSLLPDIDHPKSWVGRRLPMISHPVSAIFGHRGITHSLLAVAGCVAALRWEGWGWHALPLWVGYLSHLMADALTPAGVPFLWPWRRTFGLRLVRTGSFLEWLVAVAAALVVGAPHVSV